MNYPELAPRIIVRPYLSESAFLCIPLAWCKRRHAAISREFVRFKTGRPRAGQADAAGSKTHDDSVDGSWPGGAGPGSYRMD